MNGTPTLDLAENDRDSRLVASSQNAPSATLLIKISAIWMTRVISFTATSRLLDALDAGHRRPADAAEALDLRPDPVKRILQALVQLDLVRESLDGYELTEDGRRLTPGAPNSQAPISLDRSRTKPSVWGPMKTIDDFSSDRCRLLPMMRWIVILTTGVLSGTAIFGEAAVATPRIYFVDAGRGSDTGNGSSDRPFKSIGRCLESTTSGDTCLAHGGTYGEMLVPPQDGVTVEGVPGETAVVTTADSVTGWVAAGKGVFTAHVALSRAIPPVHKGQTWPGDAFFVEGREIPQAQWPAPSADPLKPRWATIKSVPRSDSDGRQATIADPILPAFSSPAHETTIHLWSGSAPYSEYEGAVVAAPGGHVDYLPLGAIAHAIYAAPGGRYYVTGAPEFLTEGTWAYETDRQLLSWKPSPGIDPARTGTRFKQRPATVDLSGRTGITLRNLILVGGGIVLDSKSRGNVMDGIDARYLSSALRPHALSPSDGSDLFNFGVLLDGTANVLKNSVVAFTTQNGVTIFGDGNVVDNVLIHDVDVFGDGAAGIGIGHFRGATTNSKVVHTTIYRSGGADIAISANSRGEASARPYTVSGAEIAHDHLFGAMWLRVDGGAIYACCRNVTTGTRIHDNWIHAEVSPGRIDVPAGQKQLAPYAGIYWDNGMGGVDVSDNLVWASFPDIFVHGNSSADQPTLDVKIHSNTTADEESACNLMLTAMVTASGVEAVNNRILFAPRLVNKETKGIRTAENGPAESGAHVDGTPGCNLKGCAAVGLAAAFPSNGSSTPRRPVCNKPPALSAGR